MTKMKIAILMLTIAISGACLIKGANPIRHNTDAQNIPIAYTQGTFVIDVNNPREVVGDADYVFLGMVNEMIGTQYKGEPGYTLPYTNYNITVLENIKGELTTNTPLAIQKDGGINEDKTMISIFEDDILPQAGNMYIFSAYVQMDGTLLVVGPNSNIPISASYAVGDDNSRTQSPEFVLYTDAVENEIQTVRERFEFNQNASLN